MKIIILLSLFMLPIFAASPIEKKWIKERVRIVSQDALSVSGKVITVYCKGTKYWSKTNDVVVINKPEKAPRKFSKMKAVAVLTQMGLWAEVKKWIEDNGLYDLYLAAQFFSEDNEYFLKGMENLKSKFGLTDAQVEDFLTQIEDK